MLSFGIPKRYLCNLNQFLVLLLPHYMPKEPGLKLIQVSSMVPVHVSHATKACATICKAVCTATCMLFDKAFDAPVKCETSRC